MAKRVDISGLESSEWISTILIVMLAAVLLFTHIGKESLWQDEAETALLGKNIMQFGLPIAYDGKNLVSQEAGMEFGKDYLWHWTSWGDKYLAALSMKLFGKTTFGARFLFAVAGLLSVFYFHRTALRIFSAAGEANLSALFYTTSVPFLLYVRQCRYYAIVLLCVVLMLFFLLRPRRSPAHWVGFVIVAFFLFHSNYFLCIALLGAFAAGVVLMRLTGRFPTREFIWGIGSATAVILPGMLLYHSYRLSPGDIGRSFLKNLLSYLTNLNDFFFPLILMLGLMAVLVVNRRAGKRLLRGMDGMRVLSGGLVLLLSYIILLSFAPFAFLRYLIAAFPVMILLLSSAVFLLSPGRRGMTYLLSAVLIGSNLLNALPGYALGWSPARKKIRSYPAEYIHELYSPPKGPIHAIVDYLRQHANPEDVVLMTYGDLPIKFYTGLAVHGGLTGEDLQKLDRSRVQWIIARYYIASIGPKKDEYVHKFIKDNFEDDDFIRITLDVPDTLFENSPNPRLHQFETTRLAPKVVIFKRKRGDQGRNREERQGGR